MNNFNLGAFLISLVQPIAGIFLIEIFKDNLNPGLRKGAKYGLIVYLVLLVFSFLFGFIIGIAGLA